MRLDDLARSATEQLLERSTPDVDTGLEDLKRARSRRNAGRVLAAGMAAAVVVGGWAVVSDNDATPEPAEPVVRNGVRWCSPTMAASRSWPATSRPVK